MKDLRKIPLHTPASGFPLKGGFRNYLQPRIKDSQTELCTSKVYCPCTKRTYAADSRLAASAIPTFWRNAMAVRHA